MRMDDFLAYIAEEVISDEFSIGPEYVEGSVFSDDLSSFDEDACIDEDDILCLFCIAEYLYPERRLPETTLCRKVR